MSGATRLLDVANVAGVSLRTASRVLNDDPRVAPDTRQRVQAASANSVIEAGHIVAVLWLSLLALVCLAVMVRRSGFGLAAVLASGIVLFLVARYAPLGAEIALAYGIAWFLLVSGVRVVVQHGRHASDAVILRQLTHVPPAMWAAFWLLGSAAALLLGGRWLV